jgi:ribonuclease E
MGDESDGGSEIGFGQDDVNGRTPPGFSTSPPATTTAAADTTVAVAAAAVSTDDTVLATTASPIEVAPAANPLADAPTDIDTSGAAPPAEVIPAATTAIEAPAVQHALPTLKSQTVYKVAELKGQLHDAKVVAAAKVKADGVVTSTRSCRASLRRLLYAAMVG